RSCPLTTPGSAPAGCRALPLVRPLLSPPIIAPVLRLCLFGSGGSAKARCKKQICRSSPMIPRYTRPEMASIWEPQTRFKIWFEIEAHAADALAELGVVPKEAAKAIWAKGKDAT